MNEQNIVILCMFFMYTCQCHQTVEFNISQRAVMLW